MHPGQPSVTRISPMQAALGPVTAWLFAASTGKEQFKKGLPPKIHVDFPQSMQDGDVRRWRDKYATQNIGAKNIGAPITIKGGSQLKELQSGRIDAVFARTSAATKSCRSSVSPRLRLG